MDTTQAAKPASLLGNQQKGPSRPQGGATACEVSDQTKTKKKKKKSGKKKPPDSETQQKPTEESQKEEELVRSLHTRDYIHYEFRSIKDLPSLPLI